MWELLAMLNSMWELAMLDGLLSVLCKAQVSSAGTAHGRQAALTFVRMA